MDPNIERALHDAQAGRTEAALTTLRMWVQRKPRDFDAAQVFGLVLAQTGQHAQAIHHLGRAVQGAPGNAGYRQNFANALISASRPADAVIELRKALEIDPTYFKAYVGLVIAHALTGNSAAAIEAGRQGLQHTPDSVELVINLCTQLKNTGRFAEAVSHYERIISVSPRNASLRQSYLYSLNFLDLAPQEIFTAHRNYNQCVPAITQAAHTTPDPERPLRIGILSGDMHTHSVAYFAEPFMKHRPAGSTLIIFSSGGTRQSDPTQQRLRTLADKWIETHSMSHAAVAKTIRQESIDVLVELGGHTAGGRLEVLDTAPAPVICTAIGYPNTTGHPAIGWRIVDSTTDPPGAERWCTEQLLRIDPCFLCYSPPPEAPEPVIPNQDAPITFGSFNMITKVGSSTLKLWSAVLAAVPHSRLLLKSLSITDPGTREYTLERLAEAGIDLRQVDIVAHTATTAEHLATYARVHLALDTVPYNGTTTTCEALWMGVPVITLLGEHHVARVSATILQTTGHPEWIASTPEEFVTIARTLALNRAQLSNLRATLRSQVAASPLCDQPAYAARFHHALRFAWQSWCAGESKRVHSSV